MNYPRARRPAGAALAICLIVAATACAPQVRIPPRRPIDPLPERTYAPVPEFEKVRELLAEVERFQPATDDERWLRDSALVTGRALIESIEIAKKLDASSQSDYRLARATVEMAASDRVAFNALLTAYERETSKGRKLALAQAALSIALSAIAAIK